MEIAIIRWSYIRHGAFYILIKVGIVFLILVEQTTEFEIIN